MNKNESFYTQVSSRVPPSLSACLRFSGILSGLKIILFVYQESGEILPESELCSLSRDASPLLTLSGGHMCAWLQTVCDSSSLKPGNPIPCIVHLFVGV